MKNAIPTREIQRIENHPMRKHSFLAIRIWTLAVLSALMLTACESGQQVYTQGEIVHITRAPRTQWPAETTATPDHTDAAGEPTGEASTAAPTATPAPTPKPVPKTGDSGNPLLWLGLVLLGFIGLAVPATVLIVSRKKK